MGTIFKLDSKEFNQTIDRYIQVSKKELVNEVNRRAANVCSRAASETKRANINKIVSDMKATETITASYIKETKRRGQYVALGKGGKTTQGKSTIQYMGKKEALAIANWRLKRGRQRGFYGKFPTNFAGPGRGKSGGTASAFYSKFVKRARSSSGYVASGWIKAFNFFTSIARGKTLPLDPVLKKFFKTLKGSAGRGGGIAAVEGGDRVRAVFFNAADGIEKIGSIALKKALDTEEADMAIYLERKEQENLNKVNR
jgi:hypothetical protein